MKEPPAMLTSPITAADLAPCLAAVDALDELACDADFATWCDEHRDAWAEAVEAEATTDH